MSSVQSGELPPDALLSLYQQNGAYTDCFYVDLPGVVSQAAYVEAFYTTPVFKVERLILAALGKRAGSRASGTLCRLERGRQNPESIAAV